MSHPSRAAPSRSRSIDNSLAFSQSFNFSLTQQLDDGVVHGVWTFAPSLDPPGSSYWWLQRDSLRVLCHSALNGRHGITSPSSTAQPDMALCNSPCNKSLEKIARLSGSLYPRPLVHGPIKPCLWCTRRYQPPFPTRHHPFINHDKLGPVV